MNITDEKFVEVLKSLTQEDFTEAHKLVSELRVKFDDRVTRESFSEDEVKNLSELLGSCDDEIRVAVLVCKFKEALCSQ